MIELEPSEEVRGLLVAGVAPIPFALWSICPASPLAIAGLIALTAKPPD